VVVQIRWTATSKLRSQVWMVPSAIPAASVRPVLAEVGQENLDQGGVYDQAGRGGGLLDGLSQAGLVDGADQHLTVL
jgi:hypothetical protein